MTNRIALCLFAFVVILAPFLPGFPPFWIILLDNIGLAAIVAIGLVVLTGVGGLTSFGQAALAGFGAYSAAVLTTHYGWSPLATLPVALAVSAFAAFFLGFVTVRLAGHYLPLGTIAWGLALYYLFGQLELLGRHDGISSIPALTVGGFSFHEPARLHAVIWGALLLSGIATLNLLDSRVGRAIRSLRRGSTMAESFGISASYAKLTVFVYAAVLAGLSGWLYAFFQSAVTPSPFNLNSGISYLFMAVVGGAGQVWGAIAGAFIITELRDVIQRVMPALLSDSALYEPIVFGVLLIILLQVAPDGLWPLVQRLLPEPKPRPVPVHADTLAGRDMPTARGEQILKVTDATKKFGGLTAVNGVNFGVKAGEIVALIGPNGAGKSTTFNLITGVLSLSSGSVSFAGQVISGIGQRRIAGLGIARTFQHVKLLPDMSVLENVALGGHLRGRKGFLSALVRADRREEASLFAEAARQIERVGLSEHMHKPAGSLALGQQRIVEIARALTMNPSLLLLDEPAAGLRHFEKGQLSELLSQLRAEGMSLLLVEHDMGFVMGLTDHIVVLDFGTKIAEGPPDVIRKHPAVLEAYLGGAAEPAKRSDAVSGGAEA
ncbi:branched-chain amino acid ABC transporter ATP-binding protein/permease [Rhizobium sp. C4]|uniref:branched-chain amino acid ABC transporter ATP-binding protein/permease n=1 Tax=Rhizobium sp. C4 TaxID=1349800 RepID=UPI001E3E1984|nr:branched-chain amino acid ABC transporter ATP-binding protein/permease [Rhizobium sp. C4]MCD2174290.1 branched-chain amino acid ABC transporter ATP-binding protein/permease [Rhizobium sp. C4]